MSAKIYVEGGGTSRELRIQCRRSFTQLITKCGFSGRMPAIVACGSREDTFDDFKEAHRISKSGDYIAMLVDSEDRVNDIEKPWQNLTWQQPSGANDEQALLMTTSMETWVAADRKALKEHYGTELRENALLPLNDLESRPPENVYKSLTGATRKCKVPYAKGKQSFEILAKLDPQELEKHLPSFARCRRILKEKLN